MAPMNIKNLIAPAVAVGIVAVAAAAISFGPVAAASFTATDPAPTTSSAPYGAPVAGDPAVVTPDTLVAEQQHAADVAAAEAAAAKAAADAAAAQSAADAAAKTAAPVQRTATTSGGPVACPSGSTAQGYDENNNATACIPTACMGGIGGPGQPTNEQCAVFKP